MTDQPAAIPPKPPGIPKSSSLDVPGRPQGSMFNRTHEATEGSIARIMAAGGLTPAQWGTTPTMMEFNAKRAARGSIDHFTKIMRFSKYGPFADNPDRKRIVEIAQAGVAYVRPLYDRPVIAECGNCGERLPGKKPGVKKQKLWNPFSQTLIICYACASLPTLEVLIRK